MFINDSRTTSLGYLPLQSPHFAQGFGRDMSLSFREHVGAVRVETRRTWPEGFGDYQYDIDSVGDIHGGQLWQRNPNPAGGATAREIPMWRFATPSIMQTSENDVPHCAEADQGLFYRPWRDVQPDNPFLNPDDRLEEFQYKNPSCDPAQQVKVWNNQPAGVVGISLTTNDEEQQQNLFLPTDPRLIANTIGDPTFSTQVCDTEGWEISTPINGVPAGAQRIAALNTAFRVIPDPIGGNCGLVGKFLALQGPTDNCHRTSAGAFAFQQGQGRVYTAGMWSSDRWNGPLHPGAPRGADMHHLGDDVDGNSINSLHLWTEANFFRDDQFDGPLHFEGSYPGSKRGDTAFEVELVYDGALRQVDHCGRERFGKWRWIAWVNEDSSTGSGSTGIQEGPPLNGGGHSHGDEFGVGGGRERLDPPGPGGGAGIDDQRWPYIGDDDAQEREHLISYVEKGFPGLLARPQFFASGTPDFRTKIRGKSKQQVDKLRSSTPLTGRLEAIGLQDGAEWLYKKTPGAMTGRYPSGVADGGFVLQSPDVGLEDFALGTYDSTADHSTTSFLIAPDFSRLALGTPDPTNAEIMSAGFALDYESTTPSLRLRHWSGSAWTSYLTASAASGLEADANLSAKKALVLADGGALTISGGAVTVTASYHSLK